MTAKHIVIQINEILVNVLNPRYEPQEDELVSMDLIINTGKILNLIKDIAQYGLDPSESLIVSYDEELKAYVSEEGNRRATAVKIFNNPEITPSFTNDRDKFISKVKKIKEQSQFNGITQINCVTFDDNETMNHFIQLKHTGENDGAGRISWDRESQIRFSKERNQFSMYLLNYLSAMFPNTKKFHTSTIESRIIGDPAMRTAFDMELDKKVPIIKINSLKGYKRFYFIVNSLIDETFNVNNFYYKSDRQEFISEYFTNGKFDEGSIDDSNTDFFNHQQFTDTKIDAKDNSYHPNLFDIQFDYSEKYEEQKGLMSHTKNDTLNDLNIKNQEMDDELVEEEYTGDKSIDDKSADEETNEEAADQNNSNEVNSPESDNDNKRDYNRRQKEPKPREYLFKGINYSGNSIGISYTLSELHRIDLNSFPLASTILIRTLLECTIQEYILLKKINIQIKNNKSIKDLSIDSLLKECTDNGKGNFKELEKDNKLIARILWESNQKRDPDELNLVAHGNYREPSLNALLDIERRWFHALEIMIKEISGQNN